jgi:hypothetical protein
VRILCDGKFLIAREYVQHEQGRYKAANEAVCLLINSPRVADHNMPCGLAFPSAVSHALHLKRNPLEI